MIKNLDHVTINIKDEAKTIAFYEGILGLEFICSKDMEDSKISYFKLTPETKLELIGYDTEGPCETVAQKNRGSYRHIALETDNLEQFWKKCLINHIPIRMKPTVMKQLGCKGILIEDPNGVEIEIIEKIN
ncbi:MAG: VOC family protein [Oscillospiraceae bacterium]|jgi:lactoylglutathione lyase|nr:VOC family protein [Oscillospiraceae bacterium]